MRESEEIEREREERERERERKTGRSGSVAYVFWIIFVTNNKSIEF